MQIRMLLERNATDEVIFDVKDLDHLKELMLDNDKLYKLFKEQEVEFEEVCGEVLNTAFEGISENVIYSIEDDKLIIENLV